MEDWASSITTATIRPGDGRSRFTHDLPTHIRGCQAAIRRAPLAMALAGFRSERVAEMLDGIARDPESVLG